MKCPVIKAAHAEQNTRTNVMVARRLLQTPGARRTSGWLEVQKITSHKRRKKKQENPISLAEEATQYTRAMSVSFDVGISTVPNHVVCRKRGKEGRKESDVFKRYKLECLPG